MDKLLEETAEYFATIGALCISQCPEIMQVKMGSRVLYVLYPSPTHWYARDTAIEYIDDEGHVIKRVRECALCGYIDESKPPIVVRELKGR